MKDEYLNLVLEHSAAEPFPPDRFEVRREDGDGPEVWFYTSEAVVVTCFPSALRWLVE